MDNKYNYESQAIKWSMAVLCVSLLLVYVILYFAEGDLLNRQLSSGCENTGDVVISQVNPYTDNDLNITNSSYFMDSSVSGDTAGVDSSSSGSLLELSAIELTGLDGGNMTILSGTKTYYGTLDFVEKLGISYKYALIDDKGIYYLNMGDYNYDFSDIVRKLGGNLYIMNTEQELLANGMFGDKVTYINVPEYKNTKVLILLDINDQSWLLAIDYSIYHQVKSYLKSLFITTS